MDTSFKHATGRPSALAAAVATMGDPTFAALAALALLPSARDAAATAIMKRQASEPDTFWARVGDRWSLGKGACRDMGRSLYGQPLWGTGETGMLVGAFLVGFFESSKHGVVKPWFAGLWASQS